jgi:hypothetical protein
VLHLQEPACRRFRLAFACRLYGLSLAVNPSRRCCSMPVTSLSMLRKTVVLREIQPQLRCQASDCFFFFLTETTEAATFSPLFSRDNN